VTKFSLAIVVTLAFASESLARDAQFGPVPRGADPGVAGINLYDPGSTLSVLEPHPSRTPVEGSPEIHGFPGRELTYLNASRTEQLVLYVPPGAINLSVSEARVGPAIGEHPVFPGEPPTFVTSRGIKLGMTQVEVTSILGPPHTRSSEQLRYRIDREAAQEWLAEFNLPYYEALYRFKVGRLTSFEFGFPVP
jgi:hypothetical protein